MCEIIGQQRGERTRNRLAGLWSEVLAKAEPAAHGHTLQDQNEGRDDGLRAGHGCSAPRKFHVLNGANLT